MLQGVQTKQAAGHVRVQCRGVYRSSSCSACSAHCHARSVWPVQQPSTQSTTQHSPAWPGFALVSVGVHHSQVAHTKQCVPLPGLACKASCQILCYSPFPPPRLCWNMLSHAKAHTHSPQTELLDVLGSLHHFKDRFLSLAVHA